MIFKDLSKSPGGRAKRCKVNSMRHVQCHLVPLTTAPAIWPMSTYISVGMKAHQGHYGHASVLVSSGECGCCCLCLCAPHLWPCCCCNGKENSTCCCLLYIGLLLCIQGIVLHWLCVWSNQADTRCGESRRWPRGHLVFHAHIQPTAVAAVCLAECSMRPMAFAPAMSCPMCS